MPIPPHAAYRDVIPKLLQAHNQFDTPIRIRGPLPAMDQMTIEAPGILLDTGATNPHNARITLISDGPIILRNGVAFPGITATITKRGQAFIADCLPPGSHIDNHHGNAFIGHVKNGDWRGHVFHGAKLDETATLRCHHLFSELPHPGARSHHRVAHNFSIAKPLSEPFLSEFTRAGGIGNSQQNYR